MKSGFVMCLFGFSMAAAGAYAEEQSLDVATLDRPTVICRPTDKALNAELNKLRRGVAYEVSAPTISQSFNSDGVTSSDHRLICVTVSTR